MFRPCLLLAAMAYSLTVYSNTTLPADKAGQIAMDAYVYGYSLLTTEVTRVQMTNVAKAEGLRAPLGQFINVKRYPPAEFRAVSAPNADTLYSLGWLDLKEPQVFSHPDMGQRYYLFPFTDLWMTDFYTPGTRTTGEKAADFLVTGPGWKGEVPAGMTHVPVKTRYTVILGRTYADGSEADYQAVNALQAQYKITPLSAWGQPYTPPAEAPFDPNPGYSMTDKPQKVILDMGVDGYFNKLAQLMCEVAPPAAEDAPILARMAQIGIQPCQPFDSSKLGAETQAALKDLPQRALEQIGINKAKMGSLANGLIISKGLGVYGTDYMKRAVVAAFGWPANLQDDAVYPYTEVDSNGEKLNGANRYTLTFAKGQTPPVNAFWSITMYMVDQGWWFVPNVLNKFTVSPRDKLVYNADGSLTLYFQQESPGKDKQANWLPAPKGDFVPMMRMYWPKETQPSVLDGTWVPPKIVKTI
ncbi:DUF1254 domain-containing protein [Pseudomonas sp. N040]|uniref:DUF1254 domain-containing protein n=1 Tax=Pseudomonas sp. N040 TaxID=2785325 RepID=UPI0018A2FA46|nr:DUF1254 domain-containing protein [Pseudomonas sp. N040]MBF7730932.1 DUF1254 domain-containing protein [Pseudomonas sp. N040]MBW7014575.1 DUF1214 domain-containing protein [Pseudomonas sp. N040]